MLINIDSKEGNQATNSHQKQQQSVNNKYNKNIASLPNTPVSNIEQRVNSAATTTTTTSQSSKTSLSVESAGQIEYKNQNNQQQSPFVDDLADEQIQNNNLSDLPDNQEDLIIDPNSKLGILVQAKVLEDKVTFCFIFNLNLQRKYFTLPFKIRCIPL